MLCVGLERMTAKEKLLAQIDRLTPEEAERAELVMRLSEEENAEIGRQIAEAYRRLPQDTPDKWGRLAGSGDGTVAPK